MQFLIIFKIWLLFWKASRNTPLSCSLISVSALSPEILYRSGPTVTHPQQYESLSVISSERFDHNI